METTTGAPVYIRVSLISRSNARICAGSSLLVAHYDCVSKSKGRKLAVRYLPGPGSPGRVSRIALGNFGDCFAPARVAEGADDGGRINPAVSFALLTY